MHYLRHIFNSSVGTQMQSCSEGQRERERERERKRGGEREEERERGDDRLFRNAGLWLL